MGMTAQPSAALLIAVKPSVGTGEGVWAAERSWESAGRVGSNRTF